MPNFKKKQKKCKKLLTLVFGFDILLMRNRKEAKKSLKKVAKNRKKLLTSKTRFDILISRVKKATRNDL